jgi:glycosyltransferase involved in cell wall biosynthesis
LEKNLAVVLQRQPTARLAVFSGREPRWSLPCEFHPYKPGGEIAFVQSLDIGLLPLMEDDLTRGKSPIKSLQYLACGVPVVGNVFGATREILSPTNSLAVITDSGWIEALETLINHSAQRRTLGESGRQFVAAHHDAAQVRFQLLALLAGTNS